MQGGDADGLWIGGVVDVLKDGRGGGNLSLGEKLVGAKQHGVQELLPQLGGDGFLGFWKDLLKTFDTTRWQRFWVYKTAKILNKLLKSLQKIAKENIHKIWMIPTEAEKLFDLFIKIYEAKYPKETKCLEKYRYVLLTFYDFPAKY